MRLGALGLLALSALLAVSLATASPTARSKTIASYCSPSGDVCYGILKRNGHISLEITTAALYFKRYTLCVRRIRPAGTGAEFAQRCGPFPLFRQSGSTWGSRVNYQRNYPLKLPGVYRVTWKRGATQLGPALRFRLPLAA